MISRFALATAISLCALPLYGLAQHADSETSDPGAATIRLDPNAEGLDVWGQLRDTSEDAQREPGLMPRDVFPLVDTGCTTVLNSNIAVQECLTGVAMRKKGVTERGYHSPLTVGDAEDDSQDR